MQHGPERVGMGERLLADRRTAPAQHAHVDMRDVRSQLVLRPVAAVLVPDDRSKFLQLRAHVARDERITHLARGHGHQ